MYSVADEGNLMNNPDFLVLHINCEKFHKYCVIASSLAVL